MKLIQPKPNYDSDSVVPAERKVPCPWPVTFIKFRYSHHAGPSGYSRITDYTATPKVELGNTIYWAGETVLRPLCLYTAKNCGKFEYSRYDGTMEIQFLWNALRKETNRIYHFIYGEKSFHFTERYAEKIKRRGHRLIGTVHHMPEQQEWLFKTHDHFRCYDRLITMDQASIAYWESITGRQNVHWVPNGVDTWFFKPPQERGNGPFRILFAGTHERDFETLAATIERLPGPDYQFDVVGKSAEALALGEKHQHVNNHKWLTDEQYRVLMQQSHLLLLPLHSSTFCNVVLECMACGLPVVTTHGGIEAYLNSECAVVVPVGDADALTQGVRTLRNRLADASVAARTRAEEFSWAAVSQRHVDFYASVAEGMTR